MLQVSGVTPLKHEIVNALSSVAGRSGVELCGFGASEGEHITCTLMAGRACWLLRVRVNNEGADSGLLTKS